MLLTKFFLCVIINTALEFSNTNGGIAQLARAIGSYPAGHVFKSHFRYQPLVLRADLARWSNG